MKNSVTMEEGEVRIETMRRYIAMVADPYVLQNLEVMMREIPGRIGKELIAFHDLPMEQLQVVHDEATFRTPETWFDHLRAQHFPKFLTKRFPIKYKDLKVDVDTKISAVYPKLPYALPKYGGEIRFHYRKSSPMMIYPTVKEGENYDD